MPAETRIDFNSVAPGPDGLIQRLADGKADVIFGNLFFAVFILIEQSDYGTVALVFKRQYWFRRKLRIKVRNWFRGVKIVHAFVKFIKSTCIGFIFCLSKIPIKVN